MSDPYKHILAIETATSLCAVALRTPSGILHRAEIIRGKHSSLLFVQIEALLQESGLQLSNIDAIVLSGGPGSYTGLRVGSSAAKGLVFGRRIPVYAASTLASFAIGAFEAAGSSVDDLTSPVNVLAIIDARRSHVYARSFEISEGSVIAKTSDMIVPIAELHDFATKHQVLTGTGLERLPEEFVKQHEIIKVDQIGAVGLLHLFNISNKVAISDLIKQVDVADYEPDYVSGTSWNHAVDSANAS